jgi:hypothetical protein
MDSSNSSISSNVPYNYVNDILIATASLLSAYGMHGIHAFSVHIIKGEQERTVFFPDLACDPLIYSLLCAGDFEVALVRMGMCSNVTPGAWKTVLKAGDKPIYMGFFRACAVAGNPHQNHQLQFPTPTHQQLQQQLQKQLQHQFPTPTQQQQQFPTPTQQQHQFPTPTQQQHQFPTPAQQQHQFPTPTQQQHQFPTPAQQQQLQLQSPTPLQLLMPPPPPPIFFGAPNNIPEHRDRRLPARAPVTKLTRLRDHQEKRVWTFLKPSEAEAEALEALDLLKHAPPPPPDMMI